MAATSQSGRVRSISARKRAILAVSSQDGTFMICHQNGRDCYLSVLKHLHRSSHFPMCSQDGGNGSGERGHRHGWERTGMCIRQDHIQHNGDAPAARCPRIPGGASCACPAISSHAAAFRTHPGSGLVRSWMCRPRPGPAPASSCTGSRTNREMTGQGMRGLNERFQHRCRMPDLKERRVPDIPCLDRHKDAGLDISLRLECNSQSRPAPHPPMKSASIRVLPGKFGAEVEVSYGNPGRLILLDWQYGQTAGRWRAPRVLCPACFSKGGI